MDNLLEYIDQGSFLALRAFGHEPLQQFAWLYDHDLDIERLRQLHRNLGYGLLGRRIERSPLPFGRHHWVTAHDQAPLGVSPLRPRSELLAWIDEQAVIPIDPERGPAWRMAVVPFSDGGGAVTLIVSHSVGDVGAILVSLVEASHGIKRDLGYPVPGSRSLGQAVRQDLSTTKSSLRDVAQALKSGTKLARENRTAPNRAMAPGNRSEGKRTIRPSVAAFVDANVWDQRAAALGGSSNTLLAGFAARLGLLRGYADDKGMVVLQLPISQRTQEDTRANALTAIEIAADATVVDSSLSAIRKDMKDGLAGLKDEEHKLLAALPLAPFTPKWLVRKLASAALGEGTPVGFSNLGEVFPDVIRPDGTEAVAFWARGVEWPITVEGLDRRGDSLFVGAGRLGGKVVLCVVAWKVGSTNSREELADLVSRGLADFELKATFI